MKIKRILSLFLIIVLVLSAAACSGDNVKSIETTTAAAELTYPEKVGGMVCGTSVFNNIDYNVYVPSSYDPQKETPLILAIHGGGQGTYGAANENPYLFADYTRLNECAEKYGVLIAYPRQSTKNHMMGYDYWNWYIMQAKDSVECRALYNIVSEIKREYNVGDNVYICGLSAGAAMAEIMLINYAEVFAGGCCVAGITYKSYAGISDATYVQANGPTVENSLIASRIANTLKTRTGSKTPKLLVVTGDSDVTVSPLNSITMAETWAMAINTVNSDIETMSSSETLTGINDVQYTRTVYAVLDGEEMCVLYEINGMEHSWPGSAEGVSIGRTSGKDLGYEGGINLNEVMFQYFGLAD